MTPSAFIAMMPTFAATDPAAIQRWLDRADSSGEFDTARWGDRYAIGLSLFVAWGLIDEGVASGLPQVPNISSNATGKKVGAESVSYSDAAIKAVIDDPLKSNKFGRQYSAMVAEVGMGAIATPTPTRGACW